MPRTTGPSPHPKSNPSSPRPINRAYTSVPDIVDTLPRSDLYSWNDASDRTDEIFVIGGQPVTINLDNTAERSLQELPSTTTASSTARRLFSVHSRVFIPRAKVFVEAHAPVSINIGSAQAFTAAQGASEVESPTMDTVPETFASALFNARGTRPTAYTAQDALNITPGPSTMLNNSGATVNAPRAGEQGNTRARGNLSPGGSFKLPSQLSRASARHVSFREPRPTSRDSSSTVEMRNGGSMSVEEVLREQSEVLKVMAGENVGRGMNTEQRNLSDIRLVAQAAAMAATRAAQLPYFPPHATVPTTASNTVVFERTGNPTPTQQSKQEDSSSSQYEEFSVSDGSEDAEADEDPHNDNRVDDDSDSSSDVNARYRGNGDIRNRISHDDCFEAEL